METSVVEVSDGPEIQGALPGSSVEGIASGARSLRRLADLLVVALESSSPAASVPLTVSHLHLHLLLVLVLLASVLPSPPPRCCSALVRYPHRCSVPLRLSGFLPAAVQVVYPVSSISLI
eukprot:1076231-Amphidinium_carterae.2